MSQVTIAQYEAATRQTIGVEERERVQQLLDSAERLLARSTGWQWHTEGGDAAEDWREATILVTERLWRFEDNEIRERLSGPYQSETIGDYRYQLREGAADLFADPRVTELIAYHDRRTLPTALGAMTLAGPTRSAPEVVDPDAYDVSRKVWS